MAAIIASLFIVLVMQVNNNEKVTNELKNEVKLAEQSADKSRELFITQFHEIETLKEAIEIENIDLYFQYYDGNGNVKKDALGAYPIPKEPVE